MSLEDLQELRESILGEEFAPYTGKHLKSNYNRYKRLEKAPGWNKLSKADLDYHEKNIDMFLADASTSTVDLTLDDNSVVTIHKKGMDQYTVHFRQLIVSRKYHVSKKLTESAREDELQKIVDKTHKNDATDTKIPKSELDLTPADIKWLYSKDVNVVKHPTYWLLFPVGMN